MQFPDHREVYGQVITVIVAFDSDGKQLQLGAGIVDGEGKDSENALSQLAYTQ